MNCKSGTSPPNNSECIADCAGVCGGSAVLSGCDNTCGSTLENDACDVCGGEITNESDCPDIPGGTVEINYNSDTPIAGFQFTVEGVTVNRCRWW